MKANWIGHVLFRNCLLTHVIEGKIEGTRRRPTWCTITLYKTFIII